MAKSIQLKANGDNLYPIVLEKVTNSNGTAYKFADGTMICAMTHTVNTTITYPWSNMYISSGIHNLPNYPVEFIETPVVNITLTNITGDGAWFMSGSSAESYRPNKKHAGNYYLCRGDVLNTAKDFIFNIIAVGKWK